VVRPWIVPVHETGESTDDDEESTMNDAADKLKHQGEELGGKAKEAAGKLTGNERLEAEGKADQVTANLKQAGDDVKDAVGH
jgi:uncharacterized protein YjbJ (UPF0337 family)